MLMRFEPFREFDRMAEEMRGERRIRQIPVDAYRRGNEFKVHLDVPGVDPDSIELTLGESLDREHITATCEDGVLTITIPVAEQAKPRKVEVLHAGGVAQDIE